jgi:hypothetical protein
MRAAKPKLAGEQDLRTNLREKWSLDDLFDRSPAKNEHKGKNLRRRL